RVTMRVPGNRPGLPPGGSAQQCGLVITLEKIHFVEPEPIDRQALQLLGEPAAEKRRHHFNKKEIRMNPLRQQPPQVKQLDDRAGPGDAKIKDDDRTLKLAGQFFLQPAGLESRCRSRAAEHDDRQWSLRDRHGAAVEALHAYAIFRIAEFGEVAINGKGKTHLQQECQSKPPEQSWARPDL